MFNSTEVIDELVAAGMERPQAIKEARRLLEQRRRHSLRASKEQAARDIRGGRLSSLRLGEVAL